MRASYPSRNRRAALAPALLAVIALLAGVAVIEGDGFTIVRYLVSILALVVAVFAWQAGQWWWLIALIPIAIAWNPVVPLEFGLPDLWLALQYGASLVFIAAGILVKIPDVGPRSQ